MDQTQRAISDLSVKATNLFIKLEDQDGVVFSPCFYADKNICQGWFAPFGKTFIPNVITQVCFESYDFDSLLYLMNEFLVKYSNALETSREEIVENIGYGD